MKITCVVPHYFPSSGGSDVNAQLVCEHLVGRGHEVNVVCTDKLLDGRRYSPLLETH